MTVQKALVIGLGSTGTRICNYLAERIKWELGGLDSAPFVRFLCIETNQNEPCTMSSQGDFKAITLSGNDFKHIVSSPEEFKEGLLAGGWADLDTLRRLPNQQVSDGAGNIRMVGRLAFLHNSNFRPVKQLVIQRHEDLMKLKQGKVTDAQVPRADGVAPTVELFNDTISVFVVGSLCGGTASGLASDFGYFLQTCVGETPLTAIFTIPHKDLFVENADRFKVNSYSALLELNHYCCVEHGDQNRRVRFGDKSESEPGAMPYNYIFLTRPDGPSKEAPDQLNRTIGEYLFLRVFAPQTNPGDRAVDVQVNKDRIYSGFVTLGFSTLEFPAARIVDGCAMRLLCEALEAWREAVSDARAIDTAVSELGLEWKQLEAAAFSKGNAESLRNAVEAARGDVMRLAKSSVDQARRTLRTLREAFDGHGPSTEMLSPGSVGRVLSGQLTGVVGLLRQSLRQVVEQRLPLVDFGPAGLRKVLGRAETMIAAHERETPAPSDKKASEVDRILGEIASFHENGLVRFYRLREIAVQQLHAALSRALKEEVAIRRRNSVLRLLQNEIGPDGKPRQGVLAKVSEDYKNVGRRLDGILHRALDYKISCDARHTELAGGSPTFKGKALFQAGGKTSGTVAHEYAKRLKRNDAEDLTVAQRRRFPEILKEWKSVVPLVVPEEDLGQRDFFLRDYKKGSGQPPLPDDLTDGLERTAAMPFAEIANVDVLERWYEDYQHSETDRQAVIEDVVKGATALLGVSENIANVPIEEIVLRREHSPNRDEFDERIRHALPQAPRVDAPDSFRAVVIRHYLGFPLTAVPEIIQSGGLIEATCRHFPTFHSRIDLAWHTLPKPPTEHETKAAGLVAVALLADVVRLDNGKLTFDSPAGPMEEGRKVVLRGSLIEAGSTLDKGSLDENGYSTRGLVDLLEAKVIGKRSKMAGADEQERDRQFVGQLKEALQKGVGRNVGDHERLGILASSYLARDEGLRKALMAAFPIDDDVVQRLVKKKDQKLAKDKIALEDGLYCSICGGYIGSDRDDAAAKGWRCKDLGHYFGPDLGS